MSQTERSFWDGFILRHRAGEKHLQRNMIRYLLQVNPKRKSLTKILQNDQDLHAASFQVFAAV
jgi:hypothetical protein